jgi:hypothetical protein
MNQRARTTALAECAMIDATSTSAIYTTVNSGLTYYSLEEAHYVTLLLKRKCNASTS